MQSEIAELEAVSAEPDFWNDSASANKQLQRLSRLKGIAAPFLALDKTERDIAELYEMIRDEPDEETEREADAMALQFVRDLDAYELKTLLNGEHDANNALLEINAGAGGSEACDWAAILARTFTRYAERHKYKIEIISETPGDVTGYRSVQFLVTGENAYGFLKAEMGVHRLVRISPFDSAARRHTSFAKVEVLPEVEESEVAIDPDDLKVETLSGGRRRRPACQQDGVGGAHHAFTDGHRRLLPERAEPAQEPSDRHERAAWAS